MDAEAEVVDAAEAAEAAGLPEASSDEDAPPQAGTLRDRVLALAIPTAWTQELANPPGTWLCAAA